MVRVPAFQAGYAGSIPVTRSMFAQLKGDFVTASIVRHDDAAHLLIVKGVSSTR